MDDYLVQITRVQDVSSLDLSANPVQKKRVTFMVGRNGPFVLDYSPAEYTADKVRQDIEKEVAILRAIHATQGS